MLLVDADHAERGERREDGGAGADDDARLAGEDALALVAPLGLGEAGVEQRDTSPKRARKRPTVCGVSAISGTRTIAPRPAASAASQARM